MKLSSEAPLGPEIQIACLPDPKKGPEYPNKYGQDVWAVGFGKIDPSSQNASSTLQSVKLILYDGSKESVCYLHEKNDWSSQLCAGKIG